MNHNSNPYQSVQPATMQHRPRLTILSIGKHISAIRARKQAAQQANTPPGGIPVEQFRQPIAGNEEAAQTQAQTTPITPEQTEKRKPQTDAEKKQKARKELRKAVGHSNEMLAQAHTVFPFTLFPDTVSIDRGKMTISHRNFFRVAEVTSIRIEDILNATVNVGPLFGSLKIATRFFGTDKDYVVNYLSRSDALKIKHILQGYIIAVQKKIDCSALSTKELAKMLSELGAEAPQAA